MYDPDPQAIQKQFAAMNIKVSRRQTKKIARRISHEREETQIKGAYEELDRIHEEIDHSMSQTPKNTRTDPGLVTSEKQARNEKEQTTARPGKNGNIPPVSGRFKPGQSGNPSGRPRAAVTRIVRALLAHNEEELAKKVAKCWIDQACNGKQSALVELLKRADGLPPSRAVREDLFYGLPPGSMARTRKRTARAMSKLSPSRGPSEERGNGTRGG